MIVYNRYIIAHTNHYIDSTHKTQMHRATMYTVMLFEKITIQHPRKHVGLCVCGLNIIKFKIWNNNKVYARNVTINILYMC